MIKKFVSNALLSVVMDKKARAKFNSVRESKQPKAADEPSTDEPGSDLDIPRMIPEPGAKPPTAPKPPAAQPPAGDDDPELLIRQALDSAEAELGRRKSRPPASPERQALIDQAMAIHSAKKHVLDDLDEDSREKLYVMAMEALKTKTGD
ncbi:MAG: hypothetical protein OXR84_02830 [Magnetovibrio sp.]|nr:hypothetical protein [Magnetovibrio sp.]